VSEHGEKARGEVGIEGLRVYGKARRVPNENTKHRNRENNLQSSFQKLFVVQIFPQNLNLPLALIHVG